MGYNIPKKTFVIPNLYSIHMDPNVWEVPTNFNPDRFIDTSGKIIKKDAFMPFSIGNLQHDHYELFSVIYINLQLLHFLDISNFYTVNIILDA